MITQFKDGMTGHLLVAVIQKFNDICCLNNVRFVTTLTLRPLEFKNYKTAYTFLMEYFPEFELSVSYLSVRN